MILWVLIARGKGFYEASGAIFRLGLAMDILFSSPKDVQEMMEYHGTIMGI